MYVTKRFSFDKAYAEKLEKIRVKKGSTSFNSAAQEVMAQNEYSNYGIPRKLEPKTLTVYVVSGKEHALRFNTALEHHLNVLGRSDFSGNDHVAAIFDDDAFVVCSTFSMNVGAGFDYQHVNNPKDKHTYCLSFFRNKAIERAYRMSLIVHNDTDYYDLIALVDCDYLPLEPLSRIPSSYFPTGFGKFAVWDIDIDRYPFDHVNGGTLGRQSNVSCNGTFIGPGWWIFRPQLLFNTKFGERLRFCEKYVGLGYEDFAFEQVVLRQHGVVRSDFAVSAAHMRHPKPPMKEDYVANRHRYLNQLVEITRNNNIRIDPAIMHEEDVNAYCELMKAEMFRSAEVSE